MSGVDPRCPFAAANQFQRCPNKAAKVDPAPIKKIAR
jgi:hypothetical protein